MARPGRDNQLRCPACNGLIEQWATKDRVPKWCPYCSTLLPRPNQSGFDRMMRSAKVVK